MIQAAIGVPIEVIRPSRLEFPACRALLQEAFHWGTSPDFLLAVTRSPLRFHGAAAFTVGQRRHDARKILRFGMRVAPPRRGAGVGSQQMASIENAARRRGIDTLSSMAIVGLNDDWSSFLKRRGFERIERLHTFEADLRSITDSYFPMRARLNSRGMIPEGVAIIPLRQAPISSVANLLATNLGSAIEGYEDSLRARLQARSANAGYALLIGDDVRAVLMHRIVGERATTDAIVVDPGLRSDGARIGWANVLILSHALEHYESRGVRRVRYVISATNQKALKQYMRFAPDEVEVSDFYERPLDASLKALDSVDSSRLSRSY
jgi:GNAT superfamily N-acetyltransferase